MHARLEQPAQFLRVAIGLMATLAGLDKFFNILADWGGYVSPAAAGLLPFSVETFMGLVSVIEIAVGLAILTLLPVVGAYVASAWLLLVAVNLTMGGFLDIAVRDIVLSVGALALGRMMEVRSTSEVRVVEVREARRATTA